MIEGQAVTTKLRWFGCSIGGVRLGGVRLASRSAQRGRVDGRQRAFNGDWPFITKTWKRDGWFAPSLDGIICRAETGRKTFLRAERTRSQRRFCLVYIWLSRPTFTRHDSHDRRQAGT